MSHLIEKYKSKLVGNKYFNKFGTTFPLLLKLIDASEYLSIQVHPNNSTSANSDYNEGKTKMWYVADNNKDIKNQATQLLHSEYFTINKIAMDTTIIRDYTTLDSFITFMCVEGGCDLMDSTSNREAIKYGETIMLSAQSSVVKFIPKQTCTLL